MALQRSWLYSDSQSRERPSFLLFKKLQEYKHFMLFKIKHQNIVLRALAEVINKQKSLDLQLFNLLVNSASHSKASSSQITVSRLAYRRGTLQS